MNLSIYPFYFFFPPTSAGQEFLLFIYFPLTWKKYPWRDPSSVEYSAGSLKYETWVPSIWGSWCPLTGTWDWPSKIAGNWDCFPKISWDLGIGQNLRIFCWDCKNLSNWELGFGVKINWELGLGTPPPHHDPHILHELVQDTQDACLPAAGIIYILLVYSPIHGGATKMRVTNSEPAMQESASQLNRIKNIWLHIYLIISLHIHCSLFHLCDSHVGSSCLAPHRFTTCDSQARASWLAH